MAPFTNLRAIVVSLGVAAAAALPGWRADAPTSARFERELPWAGRGVWLRADLHAHTRFSDGRHTVDELIGGAAEHGCDVAAVTDHLDARLGAATPEYHAAIQTARERHPAVVVLTGFEWNIPPGKGADHVTLLVPPELDDQAAFAEFKARFDDYEREGENAELADEALRWLEARASGNAAPVLFLNHPSRKAANSLDVMPWLMRRRGISPSFLGMEGAPGHQRAKVLGAYSGAVRPIDRWDPVVAELGGVWDQLLAAGHDLWGASATSDFHSWRMGDYWPCQFSETWLYAPERSATGALQALRAGSFFGVHGHVARAVTLEVGARGLPRAAVPGEVITVPPGSPMTVDLRATVPAEDWEGTPNRLDRLEIIAIDESGARVAASGAGENLSASLDAHGAGVVVRARGCRTVEGGPGLCFYTNPVRIETR